ncbi:MAG: hypothetical protein K2J47_01200 [Ruminococcus sp.]|nr:hypothetical protein [Ruminococcus sp.]
MKGKIILLSLVFFIMGTSCAETSESEISFSQTEEIVITETSISTSTTCIPSAESDESAERQLLRDIEFNELHSSFEDTIDIMISKAEMLSERVLGEITSEEDAIEKARAVLIELGVSDWIERTESEFVEIDGEKVKYQRTGEPYSVAFFDKYDACWVMPNPPSGITEDGRGVDTPAMSPYVIMRVSDGKVLGAFV